MQIVKNNPNALPSIQAISTKAESTFRTWAFYGLAVLLPPGMG